MYVVQILIVTAMFLQYSSKVNGFGCSYANKGKTAHLPYRKESHLCLATPNLEPAAFPGHIASNTTVHLDWFETLKWLSLMLSLTVPLGSLPCEHGLLESSIQDSVLMEVSGCEIGSPSPLGSGIRPQLARDFAGTHVEISCVNLTLFSQLNFNSTYRQMGKLIPW
jgi:hypothetical protein